MQKPGGGNADGTFEKPESQWGWNSENDRDRGVTEPEGR